MSFKSLSVSALVGLALAICAPACAQEATATDTMPADAVPGPALWRLADDDTTIYLFGTVHVLPEGLDWYDPRIQQAFTAADELVFEIAVDQAAQGHQVVQEKAALAGGQTLRELMTPENRAEYEATLAQFGIPAATFDQVEPWMAAMTLSILPLMSSGYTADSGVEMSLNAQATGKRTAALETIEEQIDLFDTLPLDAQLTYLDETIEAMPRSAQSVDEMVEKWRVGDAVSLAALLNEELDDPELYQRLLADRNVRWAQWIDERMDAPGTVFIAVGAGHLAGADSVQQQLAARGFSIERIWK